MSWTYAEEPEHIRLLRDSLRAFVAKEMPAEKVRAWDKAHHFPADLWPKVAALGICGPVSYTHLTLPTSSVMCRYRWSRYH
mgnify:CR=1 FL=1